jgi:hypothetical protein
MVVTIYRTETISGQTMVIDSGAILTDAVDIHHQAVGDQAVRFRPSRPTQLSR